MSNIFSQWVKNLYGSFNSFGQKAVTISITIGNNYKDLIVRASSPYQENAIKPSKKKASKPFKITRFFPFFPKRKRGRPKKRIAKPLINLSHIAWFAIGAIATLVFIVLPYQTFLLIKTLPNPQTLQDKPLAVTTKIFDRNKRLLYELYADENRIPVELDHLPLSLKQATIAIEDSDFYNHIGFSPKGITRATREILLKKRIQGGGSTITQQLVKNAFLSSETTFTRKMKELILSFWTERLYTKDQILQMYFNYVPYGGIYWGIEAASRGYFGKSASDLTLAESAYLAGLPAAPTVYSPFNGDGKMARNRQKEVLRRMVEEGYISNSEAQKAQQERLTFSPQTVPLHAPHFVMYIKKLLVDLYGLKTAEQGGLEVITSLDLTVQNMAETTLAVELDKLSSLQVGNGAIVVTDPKTGDILAMVGSKNYFDDAADGNVNIAISLRQPGSSIKPVTYAAALENGFTAASILDDSPIVYNLPNQAPYIPVNYDSAFHGRVPLRYALGNSYNIPAVKVLSRLGVEKLVQYGEKMGIKSWDDSSRFGLSLTLGAGETTMLDMATVFGTFANNGKRIDVDPLLEVKTYTGEVLKKKKKDVKETQAIKPETAFIMSDMLSDNSARSWAFGPNSSLVIPGKTVAVKTGTSNEKRDNWTIGYTPSYVVTVWVGNNDNTPMHPTLTSGVTGAAPIWHEVMANLLKDKPNEPFFKPESIVSRPCYFGHVEYFARGTEPPTGCAGVRVFSPTLSP